MPPWPSLGAPRLDATLAHDHLRSTVYADTAQAYMRALYRFLPSSNAMNGELGRRIGARSRSMRLPPKNNVRSATVFVSSVCRLLAAWTAGDCFTSASPYAMTAG